MNRFTKYAIVAAALVAGATAAAAPASAQPWGYHGYAPRAVVCNPYSRWYDRFECRRISYGPRNFGGPSLSFNFGIGGNNRNDFRNDRNDHNRGGNQNHGAPGGNHR